MKTIKRDKGIKGKPTQDIESCNTNIFTPINKAFDMIQNTIITNEIEDICCLIKNPEDEQE